MEPNYHSQPLSEPDAGVHSIQDRDQLKQAVLVDHQVTEPEAVAIVYAAVRDGQDIAPKVLQSAG